MLKKIWIAAVLFIVGVILLYLLKIPSTLDAHEVIQEPFISIEQATLNMIAEKLHERYVGVDVKTTSNNQLVLQVVGDEAYFNSVKTDMESLVRSEIKSTVLKDYSIVFNRFNMIGDINEVINKESQQMLETLMSGLKDYHEINYISTVSEQYIIIHTSLKGSDKQAQKVALEIEQKAMHLLNSMELKLSSISDPFNIKIVNVGGFEINS
ncbi:hypothetical protein [Solibacillus daqui]|uniref:hypothetical protein n=1 Tax=Solibacillus daqui TaxID=2912187 RepID=UPI0023670479|nr:hypothetical protein [Solibacillus daqui]